jgi:hypothetical protein
MTEIEKMPRQVGCFEVGYDPKKLTKSERQCFDNAAFYQRKADMEWANKRINEAADVGVAALWEMFNYGYERGKQELIEQGFVRLPSEKQYISGHDYVEQEEGLRCRVCGKVSK